MISFLPTMRSSMCEDTVITNELNPLQHQHAPCVSSGYECQSWLRCSRRLVRHGPVQWRPNARRHWASVSEWYAYTHVYMAIAGIPMCAALAAELNTPFVDYMSLASQLDVNRSTTYSTTSNVGLGAIQQGEHTFLTQLFCSPGH